MKKLVSIFLTLALAVSLLAVPAMVGAASPVTVVLGNDVAEAAGATGTDEESHIGSGCWEVAPAAGIPEGKMQLYMSPTTFPFSSLGSFTIDEIESISYWTNKPVTTYDFYLAIYTAPDDVDDTTGWYGYRLNAEPYYSNSLSEPVDVWNKWNTDEGTNQLTFFDTAKTAGGYGFYGQPDLQDLQAGTISWYSYDVAYTDQDIDYGAETVKYISFQTGSGTNDELLGGCIDEIIINLTTGASLTIDLEKDSASVNLGVDIPDIVAISVSPTVVNFGTLLPGQTSGVFDITVDNIGTHAVDVDADVYEAGLFYNNLQIRDYTLTWSKRAWPLVANDLAMGTSQLLKTKLPVPTGYTPKGGETATLIFTAKPMV